MVPWFPWFLEFVPSCLEIVTGYLEMAPGYPGVVPGYLIRVPGYVSCLLLPEVVPGSLGLVGYPQSQVLKDV